MRAAITMDLDVPPPDSILKPYTHKETILCGPGPTNAAPRVQNASSLQMYGLLSPQICSLQEQIKDGLRYLFQTNNSLTYAIGSSGMSGMESSMVNLIERGDKVMTLVNGRWGDVASDIAGRCGADVIRIDNDPGVPFTLTDIEQALKKHRPAILFITQGESSTGLLQPVEGIGPLCHQYDCLLVVDTVASLGAAPFFMDRWEVDVAYSASQKGISCPPGLAPISFSSRARAKISQRKTKPQSFIFDVNLEASYWGIDGAKRVYHHTPSNSLLCSLREGLSMIAQEGLENMWKRHRANKEKLWAAIEDMGLELFIQNPVYRLPTITPIKVPPGVDNPGRLNSYCMEKFDLEIAGGLPPLAGKVWRIGLMGYNSNEWILKKALDVFKEGLQHVGYVPKIKSDL